MEMVKRWRVETRVEMVRRRVEVEMVNRWRLEMRGRRWRVEMV